MMTLTFRALAFGAALTLGTTTAWSQMTPDAHDHATMQEDRAPQTMHDRHHQGGHGHGPIGVMGQYLMPKGKFMLSYRPAHMQMSDLRNGTDDISADEAATLPNPFAGMPGMPANLRVIPDEMSMSMHMFGAMYGASDRVTLTAMLPYMRKDMTMITYQGPTGTTVLGRNTVSSQGIGDLRFGAIIGVSQTERGTLNAALGVSLPTGSITQTGQMLSPMGMRPIMRLGYNMQLGSGTLDLHPALTYRADRGRASFGAQLGGVIRMGENHADYTLGNEATLTAWTSYQATPWVSLSGRIEARHQGRIDGMDRAIMGPSPAANPAFAGGESVTLFAGVDLAPTSGPLKGNRFGVELGVPVYEDLNGPMLARDWQIAFAWRKGF